MRTTRSFESLTQTERAFLLTEIHGILAGAEWDGDTLQAISDVFLYAGIALADPNDEEGN